MAINFKDARQKLADATRISTQLNDIISTEERFIRNTKDSANKAKQSQVLEQLAKLDVEKLRDATEQTIRVETLRKYGHNNIASIYHSSEQQLERIPGITAESAREIISVKNDWVASIKKATSSNGLSPLQVKQFDFWTSFHEYLLVRDPQLKHHKAAAQHWMTFSMGNYLAHIAVTINTVKNRLGTELYISDNKTFYSYLRDNEDELLSSFNSQLDWFEANIASGFRVFNAVDDVFNESRKTEYFEWLYENVLNFKRILTPYIQEFKNTAASE